MGQVNILEVILMKFVFGVLFLVFPYIVMILQEMWLEKMVVVGSSIPISV
jgi:hypothetical protein